MANVEKNNSFRENAKRILPFMPLILGFASEGIGVGDAIHVNNHTTAIVDQMYPRFTDKEIQEAAKQMSIAHSYVNQALQNGHTIVEFPPSITLSAKIVENEENRTKLRSELDKKNAPRSIIDLSLMFGGALAALSGASSIFDRNERRKKAKQDAALSS